MSTPAPRGIPGRWKAKWVDEFNGELGPKFSTCFPPSNVPTLPMQPVEVSCYDPACVSVKGSVCTLTAVAKTQTVDGREFEYASGVISTQPGFSPYAPDDVVEWRACLPGTGGVILNHSSLWATAAHWPAGGEDDVVESWGGQATTSYHSPAGAPGVVIQGAWTGWHTFAAHYGPTAADIYYDGKRVAQLPDDGVTAPQYLLASIQLGDSPAPVTVPCGMHIDYVRIWAPA